MIWRIFARDFLRIIRNPIALIVTIAIAFLPGLYSWANIAANWDPYSKSGNIKVAVANEDKGSSSSLTGDIDVGRQVVTQLKSNHSLGWTFVDSRQAQEGVKSGAYYAAIIIPSTFSSRLIGALEGTTKRPELKYYVNEKLNSIAPKVTDIGANTLEGSINSQFTTQVSKAVVVQLRKAKNKLEGDVSGARDDVISATDEAKTNVDSTQKALTALSTKLNASQTSLDQASKTLTDLQTSVASLRRSVQATRKLIVNAQSSMVTFNNTTSSLLTSGASKLSSLAVQTSFSAAAVNKALSDLSINATDAQAQLSGIVSRDDAIVTQLNQALQGSNLSKDSDLYKRLNQQVTQLQGQITAQKTALQSFSTTSTSRLTAAQSGVRNFASNLSNAAATSANALNTANTQLTGNMSTALVSSLSSANALTGSLDGSLASLQTSLAQAKALIGQMKGILKQTSSTLATTAGSLGSISKQLTSIHTDLVALDSAKSWQRFKKISLDPQEISQFIAAPVALRTRIVYPIANYGSAVSPFYTNLALWVGGFILIAIIKIEVDREGLKRFRARDAYLGRFLIFLMVGLMQGLVTGIGDLLLGIQCLRPALFLLACIFLSFAYVSIIYALATSFKHIGKAIAVLLVIVQIPGSSGTYPIELMPKFFRDLEPWLPFTYGINALRETIGGMYDGAYWKNMAMLLPFIAGAFILGIYIRPYLLNLNALFDRRLGETDLFIAEKNNLTNPHFRISNVLQNLVGNEEYRERVRERTQAFLEVYPRLIVAGIVAIVVIPIVFLALAFIVPAKLGFLVAWIVSIVLIDLFLIILEYVHDSNIREFGLTEMTDERMRDDVLSRLRKRWSLADATESLAVAAHPHAISPSAIKDLPPAGSGKASEGADGAGSARSAESSERGEAGDGAKSSESAEGGAADEQGGRA